MFNLGMPDEAEAPWWPLFMVIFCGVLFVSALYFQNSTGAALVGLIGGLNGWRFVVAWKRWRLESGLKRDPELWRLYQERRKHDQYD